MHSGSAAEVGGGGGDGQAELGDDGAADGGFRHAQGDVAGVGGDAQGELAAGFDDDGERAGPEAFGEAVEGGVDAAGELVGLGDVGDEQRERLVAGAGFELVDAVDGAEIYGVDGEAVEGVGGERGDVAGVEAVDDAVDQVWLGLVGMDAEDFGVHKVWVTRCFIAYSTLAGAARVDAAVRVNLSVHEDCRHPLPAGLTPA